MLLQKENATKVIFAKEIIRFTIQEREIDNQIRTLMNICVAPFKKEK